MKTAEADDQEAIAQVLAKAECMFSPQEIERAYDRMAQAITKRLGHLRPHLLVVLTGGMIPAVKLLSRLTFPLTIDGIHATRYQSGTQGGQIEMRMPPYHALPGRTVLVIDDILDEGITLAAVLKHCRMAAVADVFSAVLVEKRNPRRCSDLQADFVGVSVPDRYVFGEGMDYKEYFRNLHGIYALGSGTDE